MNRSDGRLPAANSRNVPDLGPGSGSGETAADRSATHLPQARGTGEPGPHGETVSAVDPASRPTSADMGAGPRQSDRMVHRGADGPARSYPASPGAVPAPPALRQVENAQRSVAQQPAAPAEARRVDSGPHQPYAVAHEILFSEFGSIETDPGDLVEALDGGIESGLVNAAGSVSVQSVRRYVADTLALLGEDPDLNLIQELCSEAAELAQHHVNSGRRQAAQGDEAAALSILERHVESMHLWFEAAIFEVHYGGPELELVNAAGSVSSQTVGRYVENSLAHLGGEPEFDLLRALYYEASDIAQAHANSGRMLAAEGDEAAALNLLDRHVEAMQRWVETVADADRAGHAMPVTGFFTDLTYDALDPRDLASAIDAGTVCPLTQMELDDPELEPVFFERGEAKRTVFAHFPDLMEFFGRAGAFDPVLVGAGESARLGKDQLYRRKTDHPSKPVSENTAAHPEAPPDKAAAEPSALPPRRVVDP